jgi:UDP-N-acetylglucosamine/UDP-N-acetylgalactosamine diphosphorylase
MSKMNQENFRAIAVKLQKFGQSQVLRFWEHLGSESRERLLAQIQSINFNLITRLAAEHIVAKTSAAPAGALQPAPVITLAHQRQHADEASQRCALGEKILRSGKVAALLVAGGQGSRLGFVGPKGAFPIGPISNKPLFQLHAEKLLACARRYGAVIPWYVMTSEANDAETREFFARHRFFGLREQEVFFFTQGQMPALDDNGKLILDAPDHIFMNPDGHGGALMALRKSGALQDMERRGIEEIFYFQIDNVLLNMCDPLFIGYHLAADAEMSAKVCAKRNAHEKMGVVGVLDGRYCVIEYSDMSTADKEARAADGTLKYNYGNLAIHMFKRSFIEREVSNGPNGETGGHLPWHLAHKRIPYVDASGHLVNPQHANGYKFETFVFDALGDARTVVCLEVDRREEFSGVKNADGEDSPATARADMTEVYARWLEAAGIHVPRAADGTVQSRIEISPLFALDARELAGKISTNLHIGEELHLE